MWQTDPMAVILVSGDIDAGKTAWMRSRAKLPGRAGALSVKVFDAQGSFSGYDLLLSPSGLRQPVARLADADEKWEKDRAGDWFLFRRFRFNRRAFDAARRELLELSGISEYLIDEVGPMELDGAGFSPLVAELLERRVNLVLSVRPSLTEKIPAHFKFIPAEIIRL